MLHCVIKLNEIFMKLKGNEGILYTYASGNSKEVELHIYAKGGHGLSLCDENTALQTRPDLINPQTGTWFKLVTECLKY